MTIKNQLIADRDKALREGDTLRLNTLRYVLGAIEAVEVGGKKGRQEATDETVTKVLRTTTKSFVEPAEALAAKALKDGDVEAAVRFLEEVKRLAIVLEYLPTILNEAATRALIEAAVEGGANNIGAVMGSLKGRQDVDRKLASDIAKELLTR